MMAGQDEKQYDQKYRHIFDQVKICDVQSKTTTARV